MSRYAFLTTILALFLLALVSRCVSLDSNQIAPENEHGLPEKRSNWANFQGSWGKRDPNDLAEEKRNWKNFQGSWGKRDSSDDFQDEDEELEKRANGWSQLHGTWGKRYNNGLDADYLRSLLQAYNLPSASSSSDEDIAMPLKREWSKFAGSWGKRPYGTRPLSPRSTNWSSLRGSWGKRAGDWSQLRGVWGKKAAEV